MEWHRIVIDPEHRLPQGFWDALAEEAAWIEDDALRAAVAGLLEVDETLIPSALADEAMRFLSGLPGWGDEGMHRAPIAVYPLLAGAGEEGE